jgi:hypothetical protein
VIAKVGCRDAVGAALRGLIGFIFATRIIGFPVGPRHMLSRSIHETDDPVLAGTGLGAASRQGRKMRSMQFLAIRKAS